MTAILIVTFAVPILFGVFMCVTIVLTVLDRKKKKRKKRTAPDGPFLSVVMPTYNAGDSLPGAIASLYQVRDPSTFELIVVDDGSTDQTANKLTLLRERYRFAVLTKKSNEGKARALNDGCRQARGDVILIIDSDTVLAPAVIQDLLGRLEDPRVGAVSSRYRIKNKGFLPKMVAIEDAMLAFGQAVHNFASVLSLWGGCMILKRNALEDIRDFRENMLLEDMDAALRLKEKGWKVEQTWTPVETDAPSSVKDWLRQKLRWAAGGMQCLLAHPRTFMKNPVFVAYLIFYWLVSAITVFSLISPFEVDRSASWILVGSYVLLSLPYAIAGARPGQKMKGAFLVFPYAFVYVPILAVVGSVGFCFGINKFFKLRRGGRAW